MENQSNFQAKVDSFNTYLKMVSEQIAEGVGYVVDVIELLFGALLKFL